MVLRQGWSRCKEGGGRTEVSVREREWERKEAIEQRDPEKGGGGVKKEWENKGTR